MKRVVLGNHHICAGVPGKIIGPDYRDPDTNEVWTPVKFVGTPLPVFVQREFLEPDTQFQKKRIPAPASAGKSSVRWNAERDPNYCPYCLRCRGLVRMVKVEAFYWRCNCGAEHDERTEAL